MGSLADRLRKNSKHLQKWARREGITCLRLYDHDVPEYPLILENYEGHLVAYLSERPWSDMPEYRQNVQEEISQVIDFSQLVLKDRGVRPSSHPKGAEGLTVQEGGLRFEIQLEGLHDSGLFLDHRKTRAMVRERSAGKRVLNLFSYTGSFSVYAAAGGASHVVSVDLSQPYLNWTQRNLALNSLEDGRHRAVHDDVLQWLRLACAFEQRYDLIVCDPPTFSNSKRMLEILDTARNHATFLDHCQQLLSPGGELFFSTNAAHFRLDPGLTQYQEITEQTRCEDYRRGGGHRCWYFQQPLRKAGR